MSYQPIEDYGITGDLHAIALVGLNGSIDWLCYPHFDSPSVLAAILDDGMGGRLAISPAQWVCENREREDEWAWEVRGGRALGGNRSE